MRITCACLCALLAVSAGAYAQNLPIVQLENGANEISLAVSSQYQDLKNVWVNVEPALLPKWLTVEKSLDAVDVKKGEISEKQLMIRCNVDSPPQDAAVVVPFTLSDRKGNSWTFRALIQTQSAKPLETALYANAPNPFNPSTTIRFSLKETIHARLLIYNSLGQVVRTLADGRLSVGMHSMLWNGADHRGRKVASGMYFYTLTAGNFKQTRKMMINE